MLMVGRFCAGNGDVGFHLTHSNLLPCDSRRLRPGGLDGTVERLLHGMLGRHLSLVEWEFAKLKEVTSEIHDCREV
jgi:hypothetical protein